MGEVVIGIWASKFLKSLCIKPKNDIFHKNPLFFNHLYILLTFYITCDVQNVNNLKNKKIHRGNNTMFDTKFFYSAYYIALKLIKNFTTKRKKFYWFVVSDWDNKFMGDRNMGV